MILLSCKHYEYFNLRILALRVFFVTFLSVSLSILLTELRWANRHFILSVLPNTLIGGDTHFQGQPALPNPLFKAVIIIDVLVSNYS